MTTIKQKLPIGISDFKKLIEGNYYYIDKSLLIKELLDGGTEATLIPRPRRFGKTLNLSMLRYFFEKTKQSNAHLFKDLEIAKHDSCMAGQGQYPVIFLTFKDVKVSNWNECWNTLKTLIIEECQRHRYVLEGDILDEHQKNTFKELLNQNAQTNIYANMLKNLSDILTHYYSKKTIILIDEYDAPIHAGYLNNYYKDVIEFMRNFLSGGLKDNSHLEFAVLSGILRVSRESIFSGLNNLEVCSMLSHAYDEKFGLVQEEVEAILKQYQPTCNINDIRAWYDGYNIGIAKIYNPWSILNFAKTGRLEPHWVNTSDNAIIQSIIANGSVDFKEDVEKLMSWKKLTKPINENIIFQEVDVSSNALWNFLFFTGYLTVNNICTKNFVMYADFFIPNNEIMSLYNSIIIEWFAQNVSLKNYQQMLTQLTNANTTEFKKIFKQFTQQSLSFFDVGGSEPEKFYHALVLGMLVSLHDTHAIKSNRESGLGRYDVMLIPHDKNKCGIIIEFKKIDVDENETLTTAAQNALKQIEDKKYATELEQLGITRILKLAIIFEGKETLVVEG